MQAETSGKVESQAETMLGELDALRETARKLKGEARRNAEKHANELTDHVERLDFQTSISGNADEQRASGAIKLLKKAWADLENNIKQSSKDLERELKERH